MIQGAAHSAKILYEYKMEDYYKCCLWMLVLGIFFR
jgi:hypothetical protein